jgi:nicotinate-nucleotide pyrophosphorylase (carboxylating)
MILNQSKLKEQIKQWLDEDVGFGDITTQVTVPKEVEGKGMMYAKADGVVAGIPVVKAVFAEVDPSIKVIPQTEEGQQIEKGTILVELEGRLQSILEGERVALNVMQRMSGIATRTRQVVDAAKKSNPNVRVVDTRKTTPGLRMIEKYAVSVGGGHSHRYGLFDAVLIKDNHIKGAGGLKEAVTNARELIPHTMTIEVEVENIQQVHEALESKADIIMFDNMSPEQMKEAVRLIGDQAKTEASGGITIDNIESIAALGVDIISLGSITHSVKVMDISLDLFEKKMNR